MIKGISEMTEEELNVLDQDRNYLISHAKTYLHENIIRPKTTISQICKDIKAADIIHLKRIIAPLDPHKINLKLEEMGYLYKEGLIYKPTILGKLVGMIDDAMISYTGEEFYVLGYLPAAQHFIIDWLIEYYPESEEEYFDPESFPLEVENDPDVEFINREEYDI